MGGEFLAKYYPGPKVVLIPTPTWANHRAIFERCGMTVQVRAAPGPAAGGGGSLNLASSIECRVSRDASLPAAAAIRTHPCLPW